MTYERKNKFDYFLDMAVSDSGNKDIDFFMSLDDSDVTLSKRLNRAINRLVVYEKHKIALYKLRTVFTRTAIAVLIIISLMFTLIACIPALRDAVWDIILEWHDNYILVNIKNTDEPEDNIGKDIISPASYIKEFREPGLDMENTEREEIIKNDAGYLIDYYKDDNWYFTYMQSIIGGEFKIDSTLSEARMIKVNGHNALLAVTADNTENKLIWSDGQY